MMIPQCRVFVQTLFFNIIERVVYDSFSSVVNQTAIAMSLANLISLLILVVSVEGSTAQWRENYTICNSPNCSSVAAETAHVGQALNQRSSGENTILADSEDSISCPHWMFPIHTENGSTTCECGDSVVGAVLCNNETQKVEVHEYYCMTYSSGSTSLVVGKCQ